MLQRTNSKDYARLGIKDLIKVISVEFHIGIRENFATLNLNLETAHKLEPHGEELEFAWATLKTMEEKLKEHIQKEEQFLFPVFSIARKRMKEDGESINLEMFIDSLKGEHLWLKKQLLQIQTITNHYKCEPTYTPSHKLAFALLNDLEQNLNKMFYVEELFLFPLALKIQNK
ncbi:MAG: hemerythrin domain-containing protein [Bacteroidetes bacterium]|jgi:iron-sulfur cluster repair protein YtfE (RIC family)|nr:hemerythrin domain-containing protein [Bacteroidota bacterium]